MVGEMIMQRSGLRRPLWWTAGAAVAVAGVALVAWLQSSPDRELPPSRATEYKDFQACLLTGPQGLANPLVTPLWDGMHDASKTTRAKVSYLATDNSDPAPFITTLLQRKCDVVITIEAAHNVAAAQLAPKHTDVRFAQVGGSSTAANVVALPADSAGQKAAVTQLISGLVPN